MDLLNRALVIETSGRVGEVALAEAGVVVASHRLEEARRHARDLASVIDRLLRERGWRARELSAVIVSLGPGSFTGLRVGLASAKALAYAVGCPLLGIPTFQAVVRQAPEDARRVAVIADALQGMAYVEVFSRTTAEGWECAEPLSIRRLSEWLPSCGTDVRITGPGVAVFRDLLGGGDRIAPAEEAQPRPDGLLRAASEQPQRWICNPSTIEPIYLRGSSAEEKLKRQHG